VHSEVKFDKLQYIFLAKCFFRKQKQRPKRKDDPPSVLCCRTRALASWRKRGEKRIERTAQTTFLYMRLYWYRGVTTAGLGYLEVHVHEYSAPWAVG
jgi:hypothetical protein